MYNLHQYKLDTLHLQLVSHAISPRSIDQSDSFFISTFFIVFISCSLEKLLHLGEFGKLVRVGHFLEVAYKVLSTQGFLATLLLILIWR
jgi:hypothetical protein